MVTYLGSLVQLCCGEGGTLQKNITGLCGECLQCLGHTAFAPPPSLLTACVFSGSTLLRLQVALQGNCQKQALGCVHFPGLSCSGSGSWVPPQRHRLGWASILCPSQVRAAQATRCLVSTLSPGGVVRLITSPVPAARFPGCAAGAPSQVCRVSPLGG